MSLFVTNSKLFLLAPGKILRCYIPTTIESLIRVFGSKRAWPKKGREQGSGVAEVHGALSEEGGLGPLAPMSMT